MVFTPTYNWRDLGDTGTPGPTGEMKILVDFPSCSWLVVLILDVPIDGHSPLVN